MIIFFGVLGLLTIYFINLFIARYIKKITLAFYDESNDREASFTFLKKNISRYLSPTYFVTLLFIFIIIFFEFSIYFKIDTPLFIICLVLSIVIYLLIAKTTTKFIKATDNQIRDLTYDKKQAFVVVKLTILSITCQLINISIFFFMILSLLYFMTDNPGLLFTFSLILILLLTINTLISRYSTNIYLLVFNAKILTNTKLTHYVSQFLENPPILYYFESQSIKFANALATGGRTPAIFISGYLYENLTEEELLAVVTHELGHIHHKHINKRLRYNKIGLLIMSLWSLSSFYLIFHVMDKAGVMMAIWILVALIFFITYFGYFTFKRYRKQEIEADSFMVESGIKTSVAIDMLIKLAKLNYIQVNAELDVTFKAHPSIQKRIDYLSHIKPPEHV